MPFPVRCLAAVAPLLTTAAIAQPTIFTRIAGSSTPLPSASGTFANVGGPPAVSGGAVVFVGDNGAGGVRGLYTTLGGALRRIADSTQTMPENTVHFNGFGAPSINGGIVAWFSVSPPFSGNRQGVFAEIGGAVQVVANKGQAVPNAGGAVFNGFSDPTTFGGGIAIHGFASPGDGLYLFAGGTLSRLADTTTQGPGSLTFEFFSRPALAPAAAFAFLSSQGGNQALYTFASGTFTRQLGVGDTVPDRASAIASLTDAAFDDTSVVLTVSDGPGTFLISNVAGQFHTIADTNTPIPGGSGNFAQFGFGIVPAVQGDTVAFLGFDSGSNGGLYIARGGQIRPFIVAGQHFDGRQVATLNFGPEGFRDGTLAFSVVFADQSVGVYTAPLNQAACYANCDNSTTPPILTVADFACFLNKFAAGDPYANCDGSTTVPTLTIADFGCFLNRFAAGCS